MNLSLNPIILGPEVLAEVLQDTRGMGHSRSVTGSNGRSIIRDKNHHFTTCEVRSSLLEPLLEVTGECSPGGCLLIPISQPEMFNNQKQLLRLHCVAVDRWTHSGHHMLYISMNRQNPSIACIPRKQDPASAQRVADGNIRISFENPTSRAVRGAPRGGPTPHPQQSTAASQPD